jgi:NAD(P)-dependent dehydrogenase (short-subunit alcohol dehydrogenase family)
MSSKNARLANKSIIVTGGTSGIGAAIARSIISEGGQVLVHGINKVEGEALVASLGERASLCIADLAHDDAPQVIVNAALAAFGKIDGLVNNAAIIERSNLGAITPNGFDQTIAVNTKAPLFLIQAAHPHLVKTKGAVLNIGSINAYAGESTLLAYSMSKGALQTMTRNLANALGVTGVRINLINPGWILTEREDRDQVARGLEVGWHKKLDRTAIPLGEMSTPENLAHAAIYWLSDESYPFTGSVVELEQFSIIGRNPEKL